MNNQILDENLIPLAQKSLFKTRPVIIWSAILLIGLVFRFMHWPFSSLLILVGSAGFHAYNFNGLIKKSLRNNLNIILSCFGFLWATFMAVGAFFLNGIPYNLAGFTVYAVSFFVSFIIYYAWFVNLEKKAEKLQHNDQ